MKTDVPEFVPQSKRQHSTASLALNQTESPQSKETPLNANVPPFLPRECQVASIQTANDCTSSRRIGHYQHRYASDTSAYKEIADIQFGDFPPMIDSISSLNLFKHSTRQFTRRSTDKINRDNSNDKQKPASNDTSRGVVSNRFNCTSNDISVKPNKRYTNTEADLQIFNKNDNVFRSNGLVAKSRAYKYQFKEHANKCTTNEKTSGNANSYIERNAEQNPRNGNNENDTKICMKVSGKARSLISAYPKLNGNMDRDLKMELNGADNEKPNENCDSVNSVCSAQKSIKKGDDNALPLSYAKMVVPNKREIVQASANTCATYDKPRTSSKSKLLAESTKAKTTPSKIFNGKDIRKPLTPIEKPNDRNYKLDDISDEWFKVDSKGKKYIISDNPSEPLVTNNGHAENEPNKRKMHKIAMELQVDLAKDSDLAMDIMGAIGKLNEKPIVSGNVTRINATTKKERRNNDVAIAKTKKKSNKTSKAPKKPQKKTFDIIEPDFTVKPIVQTIDTAADERNETKEDSSEEWKTLMDAIDNRTDDIYLKDISISSEDELTFDPNIFASPSTFTSAQLQPTQPSFSWNGDGLSVGNGQQHFKDEEKIVFKVLEQLNKSTDDVNDQNVACIANVRPRPYQNAYSANHFLEHFFGDRNDKRAKTGHLGNRCISGSLPDDECCTTAVHSPLANKTSERDIYGTTFEKTIAVFSLEKKAEESCDQIEMKENVGEPQRQEYKIETVADMDETNDQNEDDGVDRKAEGDPFAESVNDNQIMYQRNEVLADARPVGTELAKRDEYHSGSNCDSTQNVNLPNIPLKNEIINSAAPCATQKRECTVDKEAAQSPPWLKIVDTNLLERQKRSQQSFPITAAVSLWLNQVQKEKTPEPFLGMAGFDYKFFASQLDAKAKANKNECRKSRGSIDMDSYSTDDTAGITSEDDEEEEVEEEEDIFNYWESERSPSTIPHSPIPPAYNSLYGSSINYANLLSNNNELLCNNILNYDSLEISNKTTLHGNPLVANDAGLRSERLPQQQNENAHSIKQPPEVCCNIM